MNELAVSIGIILFPGLISTIIADKIIVHSKPWTSLKYSLYSFVLGVLCYLLLQAIGLLLELFSYFSWLNFLANLPLTGTLDIWNFLAQGHNSEIDNTEVLAASFLSGPVAFLISAIIYKKWINKIAEKINVSSKYGDENLFSYFLNSDEIHWVYVRDVDRKLSYRGEVVSFSEGGKVQELVLSDVTVFDYEDSNELYSTALIYISRPHGSLIIEGPTL